jgi:hypothetical protein
VVLAPPYGFKDRCNHPNSCQRAIFSEVFLSAAAWDLNPHAAHRLLPRFFHEHSKHSRSPWVDSPPGFRISLPRAEDDFKTRRNRQLEWKFGLFHVPVFLNKMKRSVEGMQAKVLQFQAKLEMAEEMLEIAKRNAPPPKREVAS